MRKTIRTRLRSVAKGAAGQIGHGFLLLSRWFSRAARGQCRPAFAA
jgi:hypothetical protein